MKQGDRVWVSWNRAAGDKPFFQDPEHVRAHDVDVIVQDEGGWRKVGNVRSLYVRDTGDGREAVVVARFGEKERRAVVRGQEYGEGSFVGTVESVSD